MRKRLFTKNSGIGLVSLLFALLLFFAATSSNYNSTQGQFDRTTETYSHTLENIPIDIKYDSDKYFISGYSYETEVYLTSTNRLKLDSEINKSTRTFKVVADLTNLSEGTSKVTLQVKDLPDDVSATVSPVSMSVTIGKKKTETFPVRVELTEDQFEDGYALESYELSLTKVKVTSDETNIGQIDHVVAALPDGTRLDEDYNDGVTLQAVSQNGMILPAVVEPASANLKIKVKPVTKTVPIRVEYIGNMSSEVSDIKYGLSFDKAVIQGTQKAIESIDELVIFVDITDLKESAIHTMPLEADGVSVTPEVVDVTLNVVKKK
ncbi:YbbR-like domain-containing protein [Streptococcus hillyeri]|uniref:YbbR-like domain-containing protein n=1 Tax=Streptococcus hillyeri TaxID=2282420 RepID=A0A3L9E189_9STRE|nr:CdaR family protein [Streptococcus hillyeri]RLY05182.1 YbbR-like domain-containing protein [Streptococcus hillyeri]